MHWVHPSKTLSEVCTPFSLLEAPPCLGLTLLNTDPPHPDRLTSTPPCQARRPQVEQGPYFYVPGIVRLDVLVASACGSATTQSLAVKVRLACCPRVCGSHDWFDP